MDVEEGEFVGAQQVQRAPITWEAHEYVHTEKGRDWYWALGLIAVAGTVAALLFNNILFAVLILISSFSLALMASHKPDLVTFTLSQRGVRVDDTLYPFQTLESFGIDETPGHTPRLIFKSNKIFSPGLSIPLEDVHPDEIHDFLLDFLPEGDHTESLSHRIMEYLGF